MKCDNPEDKPSKSHRWCEACCKFISSKDFKTHRLTHIAELGPISDEIRKFGKDIYYD